MQATDLFVWGIFLGILLMCFLGKKYKSYKIKKMLKRAKTAEKKAVVFLEKAGYRVLDVQLVEKVTIYIDNQPHESTIRADLIVQKGFKKYVVEVKTGQQTSATLPNVRRQLLEYDLVYQPDGILLLDMEKEKLKEIRFTCRKHNLRSSGYYFCALAAGIFLGYVILKMLG